jgi:hypothetical protein
LTALGHPEGLVVVVAAHVTSRHGRSPADGLNLRGTTADSGLGSRFGWLRHSVMSMSTPP